MDNRARRVRHRAADGAGDVGSETGVLEEEYGDRLTIPSRGGGIAERRRQTVAALVVDGLSDREIATHLNLSHHTVTQYVKGIYRRLGVDSRVSLTRVLLRPPRGQ